MRATEGKLVVLDDANAILMLDDQVYPEHVLAVNTMLKENIPGWNIIVFGGLAGEVVDLRGHPELRKQHEALYEKIWAAMDKLSTP